MKYLQFLCAKNKTCDLLESINKLPKKKKHYSLKNAFLYIFRIVITFLNDFE